MSETEPLTVRGRIHDNLYALFKSREDALLFVAKTGSFLKFQEYGRELGFTRNSYQEYKRLKAAWFEYHEMTERTMLTDGRTLKAYIIERRDPFNVLLKKGE